MYNTKTKLTIINRYYPPNSSINGESAWLLANYLQENFPNIIIQIVCAEAKYDGGGANLLPIGLVHKVKSRYDGRNKVFRLIFNFIEGFFLIRKALRLQSDVIICLTNPPLINFWASLLIKKTPWAYWSLDLYPEAFVAAELISPNNLVYKFIKKIIKNNPPAFLISLGDVQAKYLLKDYKNNLIPTVILPCGIQNILENKNIPFWKKNNGKIVFGYIGNLGEAHSLNFLLNFLNNFDSEKHTLILSLYGAKAAEALEIAKSKPGIVFLNKVSRQDLFYIDVHLVSLLPKWVNICVPSKAISAICANGAIIYNGIYNSDTWNILSNAGWLIDSSKPHEDQEKELKHLLKVINKQDILIKKNNAMMLSTKLQSMEINGYRKIGELILQFGLSN